MTCRRLALAILLFSATVAEAQPAVPAVPPAAPARAARPPAARPTAARPAPVTAPVADPDAPPTSEPTAAALASPPRPAQPAADAPPTSDAAPTAGGTSTLATTIPAAAPPAVDAPPTSNAGPAALASAAPAGAVPNAAASATAPEAAQAAVPPTVIKNFPLTAEGNVRFLAEYAARPDVKKLEDGVLYRVLHAAEPKATGPIANGDTVTVSYRGWLIDGTVFDQTKPGVPVQFTLNGVVPGWRTALLKMKVGDMWEIAIPADQAYGEDGRPGRIPPNQTLVFVVSLAKVEYAG